MRLKKLAEDASVSFGLVIPNLCISAFGQWLFNVQLGWTGWFSVIGWIISAGSGFAVGLIVARRLHSTLFFGNRAYMYGEK